MRYTIHEAKALFDSYGTLSVIDGDTDTVTVYDDQADMDRGVWITMEGICCD